MKRKRALVLLISLLFFITVPASAESGALTRQKTIGESAATLSVVLPLALPGPVAGKCVAEGMSALQSAPDEIQTEPESDTQPMIEGITSRRYYNSYGDFLYKEDYLYYDNGWLCSKKLWFAQRDGDEKNVYFNDVYSVLYLYDSNGVLCDTVIDAGYNSYDEATGVVTFQADYDGDIHTFSIAPETESIEQEKYMVDSSKTKEWTGAAPTVPFENTDNWADLYLNLLAENTMIKIYGCMFIPVNDDSFPELVVEYGAPVNTMQLYTRQGSALTCAEGIPRYSVWEYNPRSGLALCSGGSMGVYPYVLYQLEDGTIAKLAEGKQEECWVDGQPVYEAGTQNIVYDYTWNGEAVDKETYNNIVATALGEKSVNVEMMLNYEQCDALLRHVAGR